MKNDILFLKTEFLAILTVWFLFEDLILGIKILFTGELTVKWKFLTYFFRDLVILSIYSFLTYKRNNQKNTNIQDLLSKFQNFMRYNFCLIILNQYLIDNNLDDERACLEFYEEFTIFKEEFKDLSSVNYYDLRSNSYNIFIYYFKNKINPSIDLARFSVVRRSSRRHTKKLSCPERFTTESELISDKEYSVAQHNYIDFPDKISFDINHIAIKYFTHNDEKTDDKSILFNMFNDSFMYVNMKLESVYNVMMNDDVEKNKLNNLILFCDSFERKTELFERYPTTNI